jgi:hypothetical protein
MASQSLKLISKYPSIICLISEKSLNKMFLLFESDDVDANIKLILSEFFVAVSALIIYRKLFL